MAAPDADLHPHRPAIARYVRRLVRDRAEAEDLTQETFVRAIRDRATLRDDAALLSWLYQIATHVCLDRLRQRARILSHNSDERLEDLRVADTRTPSALRVVQQLEMSACVQQYVARLSDTYRAVLLLHDVDGLTDGEISGLLGVPLTTVKMRLHRARQKLQVMLDEACAVSQDDRGVVVCEPKPNH
ncbi:MAG: RNA polymerase sigma factor [Acidobacteriia bacterium]|nr:RNA polymerase sigma factor [Terriglobia bacterium]